METPPDAPPPGEADGLYPVAGEPVGAGDLVVPKARDLAAFASDPEVPFVDLVECRRVETAEVVVLDVHPEVPQDPVHDVRRVERVAVAFDVEDRHQPNPLALRTSFPLVPHLNVGPEGAPRSVCLFETPYADQKVTWTAAAFVRQLLHRLAATARGEAHDEDQPLEQLFLGSLTRVVLPAAFFDPTSEPPIEDLVVYGVDRTLDLAVLVAAPETEIPPRTGRHRFAVASYTAAPRTHGVVRLHPDTLAALVDFLGDEGPRFVDALRDRLDALRDAGTPLDRPLLVVVRFPTRRTDDDDPERVEVWAFGTFQTLTEVGVDLGHWEAPAETDGVPGRLLIRDTDRTGAGTRLDLLNPTPALTRDDAAAYNGVAPDRTRYVAVGAGALGSHVLPPLARAGHGVWTVIDGDHLLPHNVARHALTRGAVGYPKAVTLAYTLNDLYDEPVAEGVPADILREPPQALADALAAAEVVLDLAASVAVARHLALDAATEARRVSLFLSPSGTDLVVLAEPADRALRLDLVEMEYYRALLRDPRLSGHLRDPDAPVRYAHACRDVSARLPHDAVMLHGAVGARAVRTLGPGARACVWRTDSDLSSVSVELVPGPYVEADVGGWTVSVAHRVLDAAYRQRVSHLPNETGGVLIGAFDTARRRLYVVDHLPAPPDSVRRPTAYIRGAEGLAEAVEGVRAFTAGQLDYVGEWHSHPRGAALSPSGDDRVLFAWLADHRRFDGLPAVMAIVGDGASAWFVGDVDRPSTI